jgi:hypothetical protein
LQPKFSRGRPKALREEIKKLRTRKNYDKIMPLRGVEDAGILEVIAVC